MNIRLRIIGLSLIIFQTAFGQSVDSNHDIIRDQIISGLDSLQMADLVKPSKLKIVFGMPDGEKRAFLNSTLIQYFARREITINSANADKVLHIERFDVQITYAERISRWLGLEKSYERHVDIQIEGWLEEINQGRIIKAFDFKRQYRDQPGEVKLERIEASNYSFTRGAIADTSAWTKYLEPAVVIASVSVLIYLFFNMRG